MLASESQVLLHRRTYHITKRVMDLLLCLLFLPMALPVMALCALFIILDSPGPALFVQERVGKGGRIFRMYKFRTMFYGLDDSLHRAFMRAFVRGEINGDGAEGTGVHGHPQSAFIKAFVAPRSGSGIGSSANGRVYKPVRTSEVTRVGRFMRRTSLDELPQIINVLKGEMSIVGPRPNVVWEVEEYQPWHRGRLAALPGITGLAQVKGRSGISFDHIVKYDMEYIEHQSLALDLTILWWTISTVIGGEGARQGGRG